MEDPKGKDVSADVVQIHHMSASFDDARREHRAAALKRIEKLRIKRKALAAANRKPAKIPIPPSPTALEVNNDSSLKFLFEKRLYNSDIQNYGRIVVPKAFAEQHLPVLNAKEGIFMFFDDVASIKQWVFRFRFWKNNKERVYLFENTGEFVKTHGLKTGDFIVIYKNNQNARFVVGSRRANIHHTELPDALNAMDNKLLPSLIKDTSTCYPSFNRVEETTIDDSYAKNILEDFPFDLLKVPVFDLPEY